MSSVDDRFLIIPASIDDNIKKQDSMFADMNSDLTKVNTTLK